jgi:transposase
MSTSILYHGFGIVGYTFLKAEFDDGKVLFHITPREDTRQCATCGSHKVIKQGKVNRVIQTVPIGKKQVWLHLHLHRLKCKECDAVRQEPLRISLPKKRWTNRLGRYVLELLRHMTVKDVAAHLGMSWNTVKDIHKHALTRKFTQRKLKHLRYLGVD